MINNRKRIIVALSSLVLLFIMIIGISYAYYSANVKGNTSSNPSLKLTSGYLSIVYDGGDSKISGGSTSGTTDDLVYTKNFSVTNNGVADSYFGVWIKDYQVLDSNGTETTLSRPEDWSYELKSGDKIIKKGTFPTKDEAIITAYPLAIGETKDLTLTVTYNYITEADATDLGLNLQEVNQILDMGKVVSFEISIVQTLSNLESAKQGTLLYAINNDNVIEKPKTIPGQAVSAADEAVLAATEENGGTSYYFRGAVQNNYVTYSNMCWRIVRVMENGDIKLTLADRDNPCGTANGYSVDATDSAFIAPSTQLFTYKWNYNGDESDFVFENSDIYPVLEAWAGIGESRTYEYYLNTSGDTANATFTNEILDTTKLSTTPNWCVDTTMSLKQMEESDDVIYYGAYGRLKNLSTAAPSLNCSETNKYTGSAIGILSADELAFAGSAYTVASDFYLKINANTHWYWTLSPFSLLTGAGYAYVWAMSRDGSMNDEWIEGSNNASTIRPAVILKSDVLLKTDLDYIQDGTIDKPYVIAD